nr:MAG TPA: hypothetical protein [Caudoviricetes sp.]
MSENNTARLAREWAEMELDNAGEFSNKGRIAAAEHIMATTTPPTMADIEWDHDKYHLHGATTPKGDEVVMLWHDDIDTDHIITDHAEWPRDRLTPNGKKYELREVGATEEPAHPATLETLEDFQNAPDGTVISYAGNMPLTLIGQIWRRGFATQTHREMAGDKCPVLRWGWGE